MRAVVAQRRPAGRNGARYTEAEKCEAVTVVEATSSLTSARELLTAIWREKAAPSENTLSRWHRDPEIEPDAELLRRMESERRRLRDERIHKLFEHWQRADAVHPAVRTEDARGSPLASRQPESSRIDAGNPGCGAITAPSRRVVSLFTSRASGRRACYGAGMTVTSAVWIEASAVSVPVISRTR
jgi:hypothetical protein